jgi:circadian clock protein KaiB
MSAHPRNDDSPESEAREIDSGAVQALKDFEKLVAELAQPNYVFRLYVSGNTSRSSAAIANVRRICERYLPGRYELDVIDVYQQPAATKQAQIIAVPTLIKELPFPPQRFVGDMSNTERIVVGLRLE